MREGLVRGLKWGLILFLALWLALSWRGFRSDAPSTPSPAPTLAASATATQVGFARVLETPATLPSPTGEPTPTLAPAETPVLSPMATHTPHPGSTPVPMPTATLTETRSLAVAQMPVPVPEEGEEGGAEPPRLLPLHADVAPAVLANYFPWYDPGTWGTGCTSGGDLPQDGVYDSDDPGVIARHIAQAQAAGLDGFAVHWFAPGDRTDANFGQVLGQSEDGFDSTVTFLYHILPGVDQQGVMDALSYIISTYSGHPRFFRAAGKPVVLFSDMYRVPDMSGARPGSDQDVAVAVAQWAEIRRVVDPGRNTWWIAEGLRADYLAVFDGLYVYKIDHACCPNAYMSASRWAGWTRDWEQQTGQTKLWIGTVMPGWNDLNSGQAHCTDLRVSSEPFARDRANGAYYARAWDAVLPTRPDFIVIHSFNEWVEGSHIEPSAHFGDLYLRLTAQWVAQFKSSR
jgi:hypothetical protein